MLLESNFFADGDIVKVILLSFFNGFTKKFFWLSFDLSWNSKSVILFCNCTNKVWFSFLYFWRISFWAFNSSTLFFWSFWFKFIFCFKSSTSLLVCDNLFLTSFKSFSFFVVFDIKFFFSVSKFVNCDFNLFTISFNFFISAFKYVFSFYKLIK